MLKLYTAITSAQPSISYHPPLNGVAGEPNKWIWINSTSLMMACWPSTLQTSDSCKLRRNQQHHSPTAKQLLVRGHACYMAAQHTTSTQHPVLNLKCVKCEWRGCAALSYRSNREEHKQHTHKFMGPSPPPHVHVGDLIAVEQFNIHLHQCPSPPVTVTLVHTALRNKSRSTANRKLK